MDEAVVTNATSPAPQPPQSAQASTQTIFPQTGGTVKTTVTTDPGAHIGNLAEVVARTGPDPIMLASAVVFSSMMLALMIYLVKRFQSQQERMIEHQHRRSDSDQTKFQDQLTSQRNEFRTELASQRAAHLSELDRGSQMFERSLEKIVATNKEGMENLSSRLALMDDRIVRVETIVVSHFDTKQRRRSDDELPKQATVRVAQEIKSQEMPPTETQFYPPAWGETQGMDSVKLVNTQDPPEPKE